MTTALGGGIQTDFIDARRTPTGASPLSANYADEAALNSALNSAGYSAADIAAMTVNDKIYATRLANDAAGMQPSGRLLAAGADSVQEYPVTSAADDTIDTWVFTWTDALPAAPATMTAWLVLTLATVPGSTQSVTVDLTGLGGTSVVYDKGSDLVTGDVVVTDEFTISPGLDQDGTAGIPNTFSTSAAKLVTRERLY